MKSKPALLFCLVLLFGSAALYTVAAQWFVPVKPQRRVLASAPSTGLASQPAPPPAPADRKEKSVPPAPPAVEVKQPQASKAPAAASAVPLDFRGLKIGMTKSGIEKVLSQSLFKRREGFPVGPNGMMLLTCERGIQGDEFLELARTATGKVYLWETVGVLFEQDKVSSLGILSPTFETADFDGPLKEWTEAVMAALTQKWGEPTYARPGPVNMFDVRRSRGAKVAMWKFGPESQIDFSILENSKGDYTANVLYSNPAIADAAAHRNKAVKGSF